MDRAEAFEALLEKIAARGDTYGYFFDRLDKAVWLSPLAEAGFFKDPPGIEELENGYVRFPLWPESRALARMAERAEDDVLELILGCTETDNPRVHDDFADAANRMSSHNAAQVVPRIIDWLNKPYKLLLPLKAGSLMERLAKEGEIEASLLLGRGLLQLSEKQAAPLRVDDELLGPRREVVALFDNYEYKTILESNVPAFVLATGVRGLAMLCDQLERGLLVEGAQLGGPPADASYIWRPSIADHEQNHDWDPHDFLVTSIRNSSDLLVSEGGIPLSDVTELLSSRGWHVFSRIAMYLASKWIEKDPRPAVELMLRRDLFSSYEVSHEYELLLGLAFPRSSASDQATWLAWVDEGPDLSGYVERVSADSGNPPTADELSERADRWRWDRLARVPDDSLPEPWRLRIQSLATRFGTPADFPFATYGYTGSVSPVGKMEAETLTTQQMAQLADDLPASEDRFSSPEEGYAAVLESLAEEQPGKMSSGLRDFIGRRPVYIRSILRGLEKATDAGAGDLDWDVIVSIAEWVMAQPREIDGGSGGRYSDLDPGWVWTRSGIADLLEKGLRVRAISPTLRGRVWALLQGLMGDPDSGGSTGQDAATDSLNSIRGKAMHAIMMYARWVYETAREREGAPPGRSFDALMPEVAQELDSRLDASVDASRAVRAVYGVRIRLLTWLDPEWVTSRAQRIFSVAADERFDPLGTAAWHSYLMYGGANLDTMQLLRPQYEIAIRGLDRTRPGLDETEEGRPFGLPDHSTTDLDNVERSLADHVMVMYWHGRLGDEPRESELVRGLFENGNTRVRQRALELVGRSLREAGSNLAEETGQRVKRLWEYRLETAQTKPAAERAELEAFGWWMESPALDADWRARQLLEVLRLASAVDVDYLVVGALADLEEPHLAAALRCLVLIIGADADGWGVYGWKDSAHRLIQRGMASGEPGIKELALDAANLLIARGFHEFRSLVSPGR